MILTDLNIDCLETNLEYLGFHYLLNVADVNQRLRKAAELVYIRKYQQKDIIIDGIQKRMLSRKRLIHIQNNYIFIKDLKSCLQLFRCFGRVITSILLDLNCKKRMIRQVLSYVQEYCSESLTKITLLGLYCGTMSEMTKPFLKAETVTIWDPIILPHCMARDWIIRQYPNIKQFIYRHRNGALYRTDCAYFAHHFPHLEHFEFDIDYLFVFTNIENIVTMIRLNPQLKIFRVCHTSTRVCPLLLNANFFKNVQESLQNLEILQIVSHYNFFNNYNNDILSFGNVKDFYIDMTKGVFGERRPPLVVLPFLFEKLESFSIAYPNDLMNAHFYNFIVKHSGIKKLQIRNALYENDNIRLDNVLISKLKELLPALVEVEFQKYILTEEQVVSVLRTFKSLKVLIFTCIDRPDGSTEFLQNRLGDVWSLIKIGVGPQVLKQIKIERRV